MRKTKIICTIGPASDNKQTMRQLMLAGMNVARLNFSHGNYTEQQTKINLIKEVREELNLPVAILLDTKGPEIRTGRFSLPEVALEEGQKFILTTRDLEGNQEICSVSYKRLPKDVKAGDTILIDDGLIALQVESVHQEEVHCIVRNAGIVKDNKGINIPGVKIHLPPITEKDREDIRFGVQNDIDYIAASFIRKASDVQSIRDILLENNAEDIKIIAKIENKEGVDNIHEIIASADGIMVARGDLGVEIPEEQVPIIQKKIIRQCNFEGSIVVTATQMLDSMVRNPRPTRAEVTDVANAILDGTDAIMLSAETASGKYPVEAVQTMVRIAEETEKTLDYEEILHERRLMRDYSITNAIGHATCTSAHGLGASAILTPTTSGYTAFVVAKFRPEAPILAFARNQKIARRLALCWGAEPLILSPVESEKVMFRLAIEMAREKGFIHEGDTVIFTAGIPMLQAGNTNMMRIHVVGREI